MFNNKNNYRFLLLIFLLFVCTLVPAKLVVAAKIKIGIVNLERAGQESDRGRGIIKEMKSKLSKEQERIREKEKKLKILREELNKQGLIMSEELKRKKEADYRLKYKALERHIKDAQEEMQIRQREATKKILDGLLKVIREIGKKEAFTYIITTEFVLYKDNAINITDKVIREYNKKYRKIKTSRRNKK